MLFQDLSVPLHNFIRCVVHSDLHSLVISGEPSQEELTVAWANIYSQYLDASTENEGLYVIQVQKEISLLNSHILETETCIGFLSVIYHEGLVKILKDNGYRDRFNSTDPKEYAPTLLSIQGKLAIKKLSRDTKMKEYLEYIKAHENDEIKESYFTRWLIKLAKHQAVAIIRAKEITVAEFLALILDYTEFVNSHNKIEEEDGTAGKDR